jgi:S-formylglutathione hydrolase FrmB
VKTGRTAKIVILSTVLLSLFGGPEPVSATTPGTLILLKVASPESDYPIRKVWVWTPPLGKVVRSSLPVVYMLHGWPGSPASMISGIVTPLAKAFSKGAEPFIAVFPDGNAKTHADSEWADSYDKKAMIETWITKKVIPAVESDRIRTNHERAIMGFSMGGYGAAIIGLHHPELFSQIATVAGYFITDDLTDAFGTKKVTQTPSTYLNRATKFSWFLAEGRDDYTQPIRGQAVSWASRLKKLKAKYILQRPSGGHSFVFVANEVPLIAKWLVWPAPHSKSISESQCKPEPEPEPEPIISTNCHRNGSINSDPTP